MSHDAFQLRARLHDVQRQSDEPNSINPVGRYSHERRSRQFSEAPLRWWFCLALCAVILSCVGATCEQPGEEPDTPINGNNDITYQEPQSVDYLPIPNSSIPKDTVLTITFDCPVREVTVQQAGGSRQVSAVPTNLPGYDENKTWSADLSVLDLPLGPVSLHVEWRNSETMFGSFGVNYTITE
jgi:hypothetical protein